MMSDNSLSFGSDGVDESVKRCYFSSAEELSACFSSRLPQELKYAGDALGVAFVSRDNWVQYPCGDADLARRAELFLNEIREFHKMTGRPLIHRDLHEIVTGVLNGKGSSLKDYFINRIKVHANKPEIMPRTPTQLEYVKAMREKAVVFGVGPAGTGKTYLAMAMAVSRLLAGDYDRIILTRPAVEAGENLGFLPGKLEDKINPYLRPLYDALYDMMNVSDAEDLIAHNIIEVAPLAFMRGRTLNHAFTILDEAQNATPEQMLMFLTRLGFHSQCVICGDPTQTDLTGKKASGLNDALYKLAHLEDISICQFSANDVVRHYLVERIVRAYDTNNQ